ncbi:MAG: hypothetical protein DRJ60_00305 [Thermoprotei archaeon]|nr:MAG: hypothetical protein DRJ60_00305 [Thermoprotei archaeon]
MVEELELEGDVESSKQLLESFKSFIKERVDVSNVKAFFSNTPRPHAWLFIFNDKYIDMYYIEPLKVIEYYKTIDEVKQGKGSEMALTVKRLIESDVKEGFGDGKGYIRVGLGTLKRWLLSNGMNEKIVDVLIKFNPKDSFALRFPSDRARLSKLLNRL